MYIVQTINYDLIVLCAYTYAVATVRMFLGYFDNTAAIIIVNNQNKVCNVTIKLINSSLTKSKLWYCSIWSRSNVCTVHTRHDILFILYIYMHMCAWKIDDAVKNIHVYTRCVYSNFQKHVCMSGMHILNLVRVYLGVYKNCKSQLTVQPLQILTFTTAWFLLWHKTQTPLHNFLQ